MPTEVIMPMLGVAQDSGRLLRWFKAEGEQVAKGERLMEIETDKVTVEIEAPTGGILAGIRAAAGEEVPVGEAVAFILAPGESLDTGSAPPAATVTVAAAAERSPARAGEPRRVLASPKARTLARASGVPIEEIPGSGPGGAVVAADVEAFVRSPGPDHAPPDREARDALALSPASPAWERMARNVHRAWQDVPHFYLQRDVDASRLQSWRDALRGRLGYEHVTHTDLLAKVCATALAAHPRVNVSWSEGAVAAADRIHVGIAVATDEALIVPVIRDADRLSVRELAERRADLVARARERKLTPADVEGGTFTISNLGMFGVDAFSAIVNAPQAAILAVGRILDRVVAIDGAAAVRPMVTLTLSFDHRAVDGAIGARFLDALAALVEEPAVLVD